MKGGIIVKTGDIVTYKLCAVQGCCPTVTIDKQAGKVVITDDNGGHVELTTAEWKDLHARGPEPAEA